MESEEGFAVELSDPTGAGLEDHAGTGTITDDDLVEGLPTLSIADAAPASEGGTAGFVVTLSAASEKEVRVSYRTVDDTATAGLDYTPTDGILRFEPGETTRTITVPTLADEVVEGAERFAVELRRTGGGNDSGRDGGGDDHRSGGTDRDGEPDRPSGAGARTGLHRGDVPLRSGALGPHGRGQVAGSCGLPVASSRRCDPRQSRARGPRPCVAGRTTVCTRDHPWRDAAIISRPPIPSGFADLAAMRTGCTT